MIEQDPNQEEEETKISEKDTGNKLIVYKNQDQETLLKIYHVAPDPKEGPLPGAMAMMTPEAKYFLLLPLRHKRQLQKCSRGLYLYKYHRFIQIHLFFKVSPWITTREAKKHDRP